MIARAHQRFRPSSHTTKSLQRKGPQTRFGIFRLPQSHAPCATPKSLRDPRSCPSQGTSDISLNGGGRF